MKRFTTLLALAAAVCLQAQTIYKVDFNEGSRGNMDEVLEPGFTPWKFMKQVYEAELTMPDGVVFTMRSDQQMRCDWSKGFVQARVGNSRLTGDYVNIDPVTDFGSFSLCIKGLQPGSHNIQTYHNSCRDNTWAHYPVTISVNGEVKHRAVKTTFNKTSAQDAAVVMTHFDVASTDEEVVITFSTSEEDPADDLEGAKNFQRSPILNAFIIDMPDAKLQAKVPVPENKDWHVDADNGSATLSWTAANESVAKHHLYIGTDSTEVADANTPTYSGADNSYVAQNMYNLNTYYWRVDEEDTNGTVTKGEVWAFKPRHLAFPGAEGYGRFATGGRGGIVYHVTNLKHDHNPGSLLYGLTDLTGPRTIVFDVSGIIEMDFGSFFSTPWVTIAAQTAPGKGICLKKSNFGLGGESICRFLRAKRGYGDTGNAMGCGADHSIIDHCTMAWGTDETFSSRGAKNITFQYNMIAEALGIADHKNYPAGKNHGFAATIGGDIGTFSHNFLVDCSGRNWSMGGGLDGYGVAAGALDMFNNVCYNWHSRTTDGGAKWMHFVNNYYKMGPDTDNAVLFTAQNELGGHRQQWAYVSGNLRVNRNGNIVQDKLGVTYNATGDYPEETWVSEPFFPSEATIHTAEHAYKIVTSDAGATLPVRDDQHHRMVYETLNQTWTYKGSRSGIRGEIDHEDDQGGWEAYPEETRPQDWDTDQDGMPDWWEQLTGSNPATADNNDDPDHDGYTLLEDYLEYLSHPNATMKPGETIAVDMIEWFRGFEKSPEYTLSTGSKLIELQQNGSLVNIKAGSESGISQIVMTVRDADGAEFSQLLNIAVTANPTAIQSPVADYDSSDIVKREFFTLDGKAVDTMQHHETYIMKLTLSNGETHSVKIIKD